METNSSGDELLKTSSKETNCLETKNRGTYKTRMAFNKTTRPNNFWDAHAATHLWKTWLLNFYLIRLSIDRLVGSLEKGSLSSGAPMYGISCRGNFRKLIVILLFLCVYKAFIDVGFINFIHDTSFILS